MIKQIVHSLNKNKRGIILIILSALCTSVGQAFWKLFNDQYFTYLIFGFFLYAVGALLMILAFRYGSLSVLHPLLSVGYLFGLIIGYLLLQETITQREIIGTFVILCGVLLIGGGDS